MSGDDTGRAGGRPWTGQEVHDDADDLAACRQELVSCRRELKTTRQQLRESQDHLTVFAGQVSHDLRTPLTALLATSEMLAGEPAAAEDDDLAWMVQGVVRAAHRLNRMVEQMSAYAREGGPPAGAEADLDRILAVVLEDLAPLVAESGAKVVADPLPTVAGDPDRLYAVLLNLVSNSLQFSSPGVPPTIRVEARRVGRRWQVSVTDDGIGIPEDRQESMFVLFARLDKRTEGSGIGLATVKRVVEAHGGRVGMGTPQDGGLRVWFELPA